MSKNWRENLHKTYMALSGQTISQVIIDCIDAAYLQGLEEKDQETRKLVEEVIEEIPDNMPGCGCDEGAGIKQGLRAKYLKEKEL